VWVALAGVARADPTARSEFERGRALYKAKRYAEACAAFEHSEALKHAPGTEANIAQCDEYIGKPVEAAHLYRDLIARDPDEHRVQVEREALVALDAKMSKLHVQLQISGPRPDDLVVTLDGEDVTATAQQDLEVDPGRRTVETHARGFVSTPVVVDVPAGPVVVPVVIVVERRGEAAPEPEAAPTTTTAPVVDDRATTDTTSGAQPDAAVTLPVVEPHRDRPQRGIAKIALIGGGVLVVGGLVAGLVAESEFSKAQGECPALCSQPQAASANQTATVASSYGDVATVLVIAGGVAAATGVVLWLVHPQESRVVVGLGANGRGLAVSGRF
jgi:hypothetical protein